MSYFFRQHFPLKPATIALKIGHLAFQVVLFSDLESWDDMLEVDAEGTY